MVERGDPRLRETLASIAPGTGLRDGLDRILRARTGALIVLGRDKTVDGISTGGFELAVVPAEPGSPGAYRSVDEMRVVEAPDVRTALRLLHLDRALRVVEGG